jgi:penicillin-binding protein 2
MRARIERPLPPEPVGPDIDEGLVGAAPEPDIVVSTPADAAPSGSAPARAGPRPYLSEPR